MSQERTYTTTISLYPPFRNGLGAAQIFGVIGVTWIGKVNYLVDKNKTYLETL